MIPSVPSYLLRLIAGREGWSPDELLSLLDPKASLPPVVGRGRCQICGVEDELVEKRSAKFVDHYHLLPNQGRRPGPGEPVMACRYCAAMLSGSHNKLTTARFILLADKRIDGLEGNLGSATTFLLTNSREEFARGLEALFGLSDAFYFAAIRVGGAQSRDYPLLKARSLRKTGNLVWVWVGSSEFPLRREDIPHFLDEVMGVIS